MSKLLEKQFRMAVNSNNNSLRCKGHNQCISSNTLHNKTKCKCLMMPIRTWCNLSNFSNLPLTWWFHSQSVSNSHSSNNSIIIRWCRHKYFHPNKFSYLWISFRHQCHYSHLKLCNNLIFSNRPIKIRAILKWEHLTLQLSLKMTLSKSNNQFSR